MSRSYEVTMEVTIPIAVEVEADDEASAFAAMAGNQQLVIDAVIRSAAMMHPDRGTQTEIADMIGAGWEDAEITDLSQARADDDAVAAWKEGDER